MQWVLSTWKLKNIKHQHIKRIRVDIHSGMSLRATRFLIHQLFYYINRHLETPSRVEGQLAQDDIIELVLL